MLMQADMAKPAYTDLILVVVVVKTCPYTHMAMASYAALAETDKKTATLALVVSAPHADVAMSYVDVTHTTVSMAAVGKLQIVAENHWMSALATDADVAVIDADVAVTDAEVAPVSETMMVVAITSRVAMAPQSPTPAWDDCKGSTSALIAKCQRSVCGRCGASH